MPRKAWESLTPKYRKSLENKGITKHLHESGNPLPRTRSKYSQDIDKYIERYQLLYGDIERPYTTPELAEMRDAYRQLSSAQGRKAMRLQRQAEDYYHNAEYKKAEKRWRDRDLSLPEWMFYYHGAFS